METAPRYGASTDGPSTSRTLTATIPTLRLASRIWTRDVQAVVDDLVVVRDPDHVRRPDDREHVVVGAGLPEPLADQDRDQPVRGDRLEVLDGAVRRAGSVT